MRHVPTRSTSPRLAVCTLTLCLAALGAGCMDPVHDDAVAALGDEAPGVRRGPSHRPGQPCLLCHGGDGPGPDFAVGGTVYETRGLAVPANGVAVLLTDAKGQTATAQSNAAGNFFLESRQWAPTYPVRVQIARDGAVTKMSTVIGRQTSCAECHVSPDRGSKSEAPPVYLKEAK